ncbi:hypothetical protein CRG98_006437 [Punica granatum]|uniref:Uncharacterized protein n=1 Tax=Punica granatum TaxID=22663 RepID=A0A2I0KXI4_PUNGR|nr:hypothetical protein CRG98_006437 [Punica granatum]
MTGKDSDRGRRIPPDSCESRKLMATLGGMWPRASLDHTSSGGFPPPRDGSVPVFLFILLLFESRPFRYFRLNISFVHVCVISCNYDRVGIEITKICIIIVIDVSCMQETIRTGAGDLPRSEMNQGSFGPFLREVAERPRIPPGFKAISLIASDRSLESGVLMFESYH